MSYDRALKRIPARDWGALKGAWAPSVGALRFEQPAQKPEFAVRDFPGLKEKLKSACGNNQVESRIEAFGVAPSLLHCAVFLMHKAANVLVAAHDQVDGGLSTWSLTTSYQSALFSANAIINFLGIGLISYVGDNYLFDVFPGVEKKASRKAILAYENGTENLCILFDRTISHFHQWAVLKRLLRTTNGIGWDSEIVNRLLAIDDDDYASQRNQLHYDGTWTFQEDLHQYAIMDQLAHFGDHDELLDRLDAGHPCFGLSLGTSLFCLGSYLLKDLAANSPVLAKEHALIVSSCSAVRLKLRPSFEDAIGGSIF